MKRMKTRKNTLSTLFPFFILYLVIILSVGCSPGKGSLKNSGAVYYLDPVHGNDENLGTEAEPWLSLDKANRTLLPGETVLLRGGEYDLHNAKGIMPLHNGEPGKYITYLNYPGEKPVLTNADTAILLIDKHFIHIAGLILNGKGIFEASNLDTWIYMNAATHNRFWNNQFLYARGWIGVQLTNYSNYNHFKGNNFDFCGTWNKHKIWKPTVSKEDSLPIGDDAGDLFSISCGRYNLVENNTFRHGGHDNFVIDDRYNVIRKNYFDGSWNDFASSDTLIGQRAASFTGRFNKNCAPDDMTIEDTGGYNLIEDNYFLHTYYFSDHYRNKKAMTVKLFGINQIFRFNLVGDGMGPGIGAMARNPTLHASNIQIYNNIVTGMAYGAIIYRDLKSDENHLMSIENNRIFNNILYNNKRDPARLEGGVEDALYHDVVFKLGFLPAEQMDNNQVFSNLIWNPGKTETLLWYYDEVNLKPPSANPLVANNLVEVPVFVQAPDPKNVRTFALKPGSAGIGKAAPLAHTLEAGTGTEVKLTSASPFFALNFLVDGIQHSYNDFDGTLASDQVVIGSQQPVNLVLIDYGQQLIRFDRKVEWAADDPVFLVRKGAVARNIGVVQQNEEGNL